MKLIAQVRDVPSSRARQVTDLVQLDATTTVPFPTLPVVWNDVCRWAWTQGGHRDVTVFWSRMDVDDVQVAIIQRYSHVVAEVCTSLLNDQAAWNLVESIDVDGVISLELRTTTQYVGDTIRAHVRRVVGLDAKVYVVPAAVKIPVDVLVAACVTEDDVIQSARRQGVTINTEDKRSRRYPATEGIVAARLRALNVQR